MVAGIAIMASGAAIGGLPGFGVTILGYVPFMESLYDVNLVAPLLRRPLRARELRGPIGDRLALRPGTDRTTGDLSRAA